MKLLISFAILALIGIAYCQDCNFDGPRTEDPRCGWSNDYEDDFDWSTARIPTLTPFTGPTGDHTTGSGSYLYTEANGRSLGEKARIYSPVDTPPNSDGSSITVITFWYSMWDAFNGVGLLTNMGTLNVYVEYGGGKVPTGDPIWSRSGPQTDRSGWKEGRIMFIAPASFRIIFEGVIGDGERSDIGIDDVKVNQTGIPSTCDFESSPLGELCMFYQEDLSDDFDWTRHSGETPSLDSGPLTDHTYQNDAGHYLYIETTRPNDPASAALRSIPYFKYEGPCAIEFYVHAFGRDVGQLNVTISHDVAGDTVHTIVDGESPEGDSWELESVGVSNSKGHYTITFEASRGAGNLGDIAIDDVSFGDNCYEVDHCASNPCENLATCETSELGYECLCAPGWTGLLCEEDILDCTPETCPQGSLCIERVNGFDCVCPDGFQGENCNDEIPTIEPPEPIDTRLTGVDPEMIPVIIGSCIGSFVLIATAAWFTATCIKNDGYRKKAAALDSVKVTEAEEGDDGYTEEATNAYVNTTFEADDPDVPDDDDENGSKPGTSAEKGGIVKEEVMKSPVKKTEVEEKKVFQEEEEKEETMQHQYAEIGKKTPDSEEKVEDEKKKTVAGENEKVDKKDINEDADEAKGEIREVEKKMPENLSTENDDVSTPESSASDSVEIPSTSL